MKRLLSLLIMFVIVVFSVANREAVSLSFWPTPYAIQVPVAFLILIVFVFGFLAGGIANLFKKR